MNEVRGPRSEPVFSSSRNGNLDDWTHDGAKLPAARGPSSGRDAPSFDRSASGKRERDSFHPSWWESSSNHPQQEHPATPETRASVMVNPPSAEDVVPTMGRRGLSYFAQGDEASSFRFSSAMASNKQQPHQHQPSSTGSAVVSVTPALLTSIGPYGQVHRRSDAEGQRLLERVTASTAKALLLSRRRLQAMAAEKPAAGGGGGGNGPSSAEPRLVPENEFPSAEAPLRPTTPISSSTAVSRQTSLGTISSAAGASFRYSEEHEHREKESARGTVVMRRHRNVNNASVGTERPADSGIDEPLQSEHRVVQDRSVNQIAGTGGRGLTNIDLSSSGMQENVTRWVFSHHDGDIFMVVVFDSV